MLALPWAPSAVLPVELLLSGLLLAVLIDRFLGEPPARIHPVVGIGAYLHWAAARFVPLSEAHANHSPTPTPQQLRWLGTVYWCLGAGLVLILALVVQIACLFFAQRYGWWLAALPLAFLFKPLFAWRMLTTEVQAVEEALQRSLEAGRERLSYLVSRNTRALSHAEVREAAIATLAENFNDSCIAPLFWFCLGGLPAAALYRYANTADASWGYLGERQGRVWTDAGRFAARADDALSWLPARLSALLLLIAAQSGFTAENRKNIIKNAALTPSPNSGWPMAAVACLLGIRLGKTGVYSLNPTGRAPAADDVQAALQLCRRTWHTLTGYFAGGLLFLLIHALVSRS